MRIERVERTSVCEVIQDYNTGQMWLSRLADIENNKIVRFIFDEAEPWFFDNRNRLYLKDGPNDKGRVGVWYWTATPRDTDYEKDFIDCSFVSDIIPIEIIEINDTPTIKELSDRLKNNIPTTNSGLHVLYCCSNNIRKNGYSGVLIEPYQLATDGGRARLKEDVISLPLYSIEIVDTIRTEGHIFLKTFELPEPKDSLLVKSPYEIIKDTILRRSSWSAMKSAGMTKGEYKRLKSYLTAIPEEDVYQEIANVCGLSVSAAKEQVDGFVQNVTSYLGLEDIDTKILYSVVEHNDELRKKTEAIVEENWKANNSQEISKVREEIESYRSEISDEQKKLQGIIRDISEASEHLDHVKEDIKSKEKLALDVDQKVKQRIADSREDAAEFIASMAFSFPYAIEQGTENIKRKQNTSISGKVSRELFFEGEKIEEENLECFSDWKEAILLIEEELASAGVDNKMCPGLATFLFVSWKNNTSVLLAGPNAIEIIDAFSAAVTGKVADKIKCSGCYEKINEIADISGHIIAVTNVLHGDWIDHIPEMLSDKNNYYIFTNAFSEDLSIEPKGLYNYMLPIFTEFLVSEKAKNQYYGGIPAQNYEDIKCGNVSTSYKKLFEKNASGKLFVTQVQGVLGDMSKVAGYKADWDYLYAIVPFMIAIGKKDDLLEQINRENRISRECRETIINYLGAET